MKFHTQSNLDPGNCWQTAVACVLDLEPEELPDQIANDQRREVQEDGTVKWVGPRYVTALNAFLRTHYAMAYVEVHYPKELWQVVQVREPGLHFMVGKTVRSATTHASHVVVGLRGLLLWDPHPSRAGLVGDPDFAFLIPYPESWRKFVEETPCVCPKCAQESSQVDGNNPSSSSR